MNLADLQKTPVCVLFDDKWNEYYLLYNYVYADGFMVLCRLSRDYSYQHYKIQHKEYLTNVHFKPVSYSTGMKYLRRYTKHFNKRLSRYELWRSYGQRYEVKGGTKDECPCEESFAVRLTPLVPRRSARKYLLPYD